MRLVSLTLVVLSGCGACTRDPVATSDFFGPTIEPPRGLAKIHPGMSVAEAKRLVPGLHEPDRKGIRDELVLDSGTSDVTLEVRIDGGTVSSIVAIANGHSARELLEHTWGKPEITRDSLGQPEVTWASESSGWKVKLDCLERNCLVEYVPYHVLTAEFFGAHVVPPGELSKLKIGMKLAEAKQIAPGPVSARNGLATDVDGVKEYVTIDDHTATVRAIYLSLPPHAEDLIAQAWGDGLRADELGKTVNVWPDPETGWRATLRPALLSHDLFFDNYLPVAQLFGDDPDKLDALPEPVLGKTVDEVKRAYKDVSVVAPNRELALLLPPTEWDKGATRIELVLAGGKVKELKFEVPWRGYTDAHDTLLDLFKHKWGDPKEIDEESKGKLLLFREEDPRVEIREDKPRAAWQILMK